MKEYTLVAVSGGPDSLALTELLREEGKRLVCLHVNYRHRPSADRDMLILNDYCRRYALDLQILFAPQQVKKGNFQDFARNLRYEFFKEVAARYQTQTIYVAHQLDDFLETVVLQLKRGSTPSYYGIAEKTTIKGLTIIRPLLTKTKDELAEYLKERSLTYGLDESNFRDDYLRNRIRHLLIEHLDRATKRYLYQIIQRYNRKQLLKTEAYRQKYCRDKYEDTELKEIGDFALFLRVKLYFDLSNEEIKEIERQIISCPHFLMKVRSTYLEHYNKQLIFFQKESYHYLLAELKPLKTKYFAINITGQCKQGAYLTDSDFPLTIRNYQAGDTIHLAYGHKRLARYFIDHKIPKYQRMHWPVVLNQKGEVIFAPKIGPDLQHYSIKPNFFMVECLNIKR